MKTVLLHLRPEPKGRDAYGREPSYRLKMLLKPLLRQAGFRCTSITTTDAPTTTSPTGQGEQHEQAAQAEVF